MRSVKGKFENGAAWPLEPVKARDGQSVLITFLEEGTEEIEEREQEKAWNALEQLIRKSTVRTGISDLAHEHDHYLYRKPKKGRA